MQYWVSPALVFFINLCMNWSHCHDAETSSPLHAASAPPILSPSWIWQVSLILQSSESLSVIKYAAGAALYVGITLLSGAVCHSNVATKKWWMERHFWSSLPDKLSVLGGRVFKRTAFGRKGPDQLCFYQSIWLESCLRPQWFCCDQDLFVSDPSPSCLPSEDLKLLRQHVNVSDRTQNVPSDGVSLQALQKIHHFMLCSCMDCIS